MEIVDNFRLIQEQEYGTVFVQWRFYMKMKIIGSELDIASFYIHLRTILNCEPIPFILMPIDLFV